jgi:hypothetical protein
MQALQSRARKQADAAREAATLVTSQESSVSEPNFSPNPSIQEHSASIAPLKRPANPFCTDVFSG